MMELEALWSTPARNANGSCRLAVGDYVCIDDEGNFIQEHPTHKVMGVYGDVYDRSHAINVIDLITLEPKIIQI